MTTLIVTNDKGGTAKPLPMVYVPPDRQRDETTLATFAEGSGLNGPFLADLLSDYLQHERCGVALYASLAGRTALNALRAGYERFGEQTENHVRVLEELITTLGGDPLYVSPAARATCKTGTALVEGTFILAGSVDAVTQELVMLDAVLLAEARDHANWQFLAQLAELASGAAAEALVAAVAEVQPDEDEHLGWAGDTRSAMALALAESPAVMPDEQLIALEEALGQVPGTSVRAEATKAELYEQAQEEDIPGRSTMTKEELAEALTEET